MNTVTTFSKSFSRVNIFIALLAAMMFSTFTVNPASAHHPELSVNTHCKGDGTYSVDYTATTWTYNGSQGLHDNITVRYVTDQGERGDLPSGAFTNNNNRQFKNWVMFDADVTGGTLYFDPVGPWGNGTDYNGTGDQRTIRWSRPAGCEPTDTPEITPPPMPSCPQGAILWKQEIDVTNLDDRGIPIVDVRMLGSRDSQYMLPITLPGEFSGPVDVTISDAVSWDGYLSRPNTGNQANEQWKVVFLKNGNVQWSSNYTQDGIDTGVVADHWRGSLGSATLPNGADKIVIAHWGDSEFGNNNTAANSIVPSSICIEFETGAPTHDFGDAPDSYGDAFVEVRDGVSLGETVDTEEEQANSNMANGDDNADDDDEDGVTFVGGNELVTGDSKMIEITALQTVHRDQFINAWIDWNGNGEFDGDAELIIDDLIVEKATDLQDFKVTIDVPADAACGTTFARFRMESDENTNPTGDVNSESTGGEVEDYKIEVVCPTATPTNTPVPTNTPTNTPEPTATNTPVPTNTPTNTPEPTATNTPVPTNTPTNTPEPTATNTPVPTNTPTNTPEPTPTPLPASLGDKVWEDIDKDGIQDDGELGIANVTVELYKRNGNLVDTTTTDDNGMYLFPNLEEGKYYVVFVAPAGYTASPQDAGDDAADSDADEVTGQTAEIMIGAGEDVDTVDAGFYIPATVIAATPSPTPTTEPTVAPTNTPEATPTTEPTVAPTNTPEATPTTEPTVAPTATPQAAELGSLGNYVWVDENGNGLQDEPATAGKNGVTVKLQDADGNVLAEAVTADDENGNPGFYLFDQLAVEETYKVMFVAPEGYEFTTLNADDTQLIDTESEIDSDADPNMNGMSYTTQLTSLLPQGKDQTQIDAGLVAIVEPTATPAPELGSLGNYVWVDENGNGLQDEPVTAGKNGVTVKLQDEDGNVLAEAITSDDENGNPGFYLFEGLATEELYKVMFVAPEGYEFTTLNADDTQLIDTESEIDSDADPSMDGMSYITQLTSLLPQGKDQTQIDAGLVPVTDPTPTPETTEEPTAVPTATPEGTPEPTATPEVTATPVPTEAPKACIGDYVFEDTNGNGIQDDGEAGIAGIEVNLWTGTAAGPDTEVATVTSGANGEYKFCGLDTDETYYVQFVAPGREFSPADEGADDEADSDPNPANGITGAIDITDGQDDESVDAGLLPVENATPTPEGTKEPIELGSIGDKVFNDVNNNGIQEDFEPGLANYTVELQDGDGNVLDTMVTNADGEYLFDELEPGDYMVRFVRNNPTQEQFSPQDAGADDALDSDADVNSGKTGTITLAAGEDIDTIDAGIYVAPLGVEILPPTIVKKIVDGGERVDATVATRGETINYELVVTNVDEDDTLQAVVVTDVLPAEVTYVDSDSTIGDTSYDADSNTLTASVGFLAPGQTATITIEVTIDASTDVGAIIRNTATVASNGGSDSSEEVRTTVIPGELPNTGDDDINTAASKAMLAGMMVLAVVAVAITRMGLVAMRKKNG